jgi:6-pyruvoyltetrahydropterin/6-carboxytetrahydropterin synthase
MPSVTMTFRFEAAHRLLKHAGKCRHLHGHSYRAEVAVSRDEINPKTDMVIDFAEIKLTVGRWIDENLDHNVILNPDDPILTELSHGQVATILRDRDPFLMPPDVDPTAEMIADAIFGVAAGALGGVVKVEKVTVWETENCCATAEAGQ